MLKVHAGRASHYRTDGEEEYLLGRVVENLTSEEAQAVLQIMKEATIGSSATLQAYTNVVYERDPVSMEQFLEDEYYLGRPCRKLYPKIRKSLIELFEYSGRYATVILTGSTGWGKTFTGGLIFARILYELSCLRSPQETYGLSSGSDMHLILLSRNLHLAGSVLLSKLMELLKDSPYFLSEFPFDERPETVTFPKRLILQIGSVNAERFLGLNVISMMMDETNFMTGSRRKPAIAGLPGQQLTVANYDNAERQYAVLTNRIKGRFLSGGRLPGKSVLISSKTTTNSFTERRIRESLRDPDVYVMDYATWEVKPATEFCGRTFRLIVGAGDVHSRIVRDGEVLGKELEESGALLVDVPEEYRRDFERDLAGSIRDMAGLATDAICSFINKQSTLLAAIVEGVSHPCTDVMWVIGNRFEILWRELCEEKMVEVRKGYMERQWRMRRNPTAPRVVHLDPALGGDAVGVAAGHIVRFVEVERRAPGGSEVYYEVAPEIEIDFMLRVRPQVGEYIMLSDLRGLVYEMIDHGVPVVQVTTDTYQSADTIQQMRARGVDADILSLDVSPAGYECLRLALYEGRLRMYAYEPFLEEMRALEWVPERQKVDHPIGFSKDVADAVAGVVAMLEALAMKMPIPVDALRAVPDVSPDSWVIGAGKGPRAPFQHMEAELKAHPGLRGVVEEKPVMVERVQTGTQQQGTQSIAPQSTQRQSSDIPVEEKKQRGGLADASGKRKRGSGEGGNGGNTPPYPPFIAF